MTIVTVFRSRVNPEAADEYAVVAKEMEEAVAQMEGFVDQKFYVAEDGERVTVVRFADLATQRRWAQHARHQIAQERGRNEFYSWYQISVSEEKYAHEFDTADHGKQAD